MSEFILGIGLFAGGVVGDHFFDLYGKAKNLLFPPPKPAPPPDPLLVKILNRLDELAAKP